MIAMFILGLGVPQNRHLSSLPSQNSSSPPCPDRSLQAWGQRDNPQGCYCTQKKRERSSQRLHVELRDVRIIFFEHKSSKVKRSKSKQLGNLCLSA